MGRRIAPAKEPAMPRLPRNPALAISIVALILTIWMAITSAQPDSLYMEPDAPAGEAAQVG